jgi:hypothetical protein
MSIVEVVARHRRQHGECPRCAEFDATLIDTWKDSHGVLWYVMRCRVCLIAWLDFAR